ncbi:polysaccharide deacetylase family protein [Lentibacillus sediminis]|uniref:polysaccharide deacetylase family protein n=1 Tax=Lentibacillus sediminis TaxID=1940529 RepID=UPI000C1C176D|nr:polysaccharide deacetylase family protein [Lentibacillus sediminis]
MYRYKKAVNFCIFIIILFLAFDPSHNPFQFSSQEYPASDVAKQNDSLLEEIKNKRADYHEEPDNAYIDEVWKKTPGRNGLEVNVQKSYEKMKEIGEFDPSLLVYDQVSPTVTLKDLPAAPIYRGHPEKQMVALLINVSWGAEHIPDILNILNENNVKATFFIEGKWTRENAELVKMIDEQGHLIGNHGYNHPDMARISEQEVIRQITQTNEILEAVIDKKPLWFAPPSGSYNDQAVRAAHQLNMQTILWTVDTIDWKNPAVSVMINRVNDQVHPGATILMHPTPAIVEGLSPLIKTVKDKGYKLGTIEKLLSEER